jgi:hypothetical protein
MEWDPGPPAPFATHFENRPTYSPKSRFRMAWGPIFYRGRLDGSAKVIVIGQDPAADEDVARRILVGAAGQRVQGFLRKLGLNKSYVMVNTFLYGLRGQMDQQAKQISASAPIKNWRNQLLDMLMTPQIQAILAFGAGAHQVVSLWPGSSGAFVAQLTHPSARDDAALLANWNNWLPQVQSRVMADPGGTKDPTPYGTKFKKTDLAPIPARDLAFGVPKWMGNGDTAWRLPSGNQITWKATAAEG